MRHHIPVSKLKPKVLDEAQTASGAETGNAVLSMQTQRLTNYKTVDVQNQMLIEADAQAQTELESSKHLSQCSEQERVRPLPHKAYVQMPILIQLASADVTMQHTPRGKNPELSLSLRHKHNSFKNRQSLRRNLQGNSRDQYKQYLGMLRDHESKQLQQMAATDRERATSHEAIAILQNSSHHISLKDVPLCENEDTKNLMHQLHLRKRLTIQTE